MTKTFKAIKAITIIAWAIAAVSSLIMKDWQQAVVSAMFAVVTLMVRL